MGLFGLFKKNNNKIENENKMEKQDMPTAEQIIMDATKLRENAENKEEEIPEIICAFYSATKNIDLDIDYVKEILNSTK